MLFLHVACYVLVPNQLSARHSSCLKLCVCGEVDILSNREDGLATQGERRDKLWLGKM